MYVVFWSSRIFLIVWSRIMRWSQVALPGIPPAWAFVRWTCFFVFFLLFHWWFVRIIFLDCLLRLFLFRLSTFPWFPSLCIVAGCVLAASFLGSLVLRVSYWVLFWISLWCPYLLLWMFYLGYDEPEETNQTWLYNISINCMSQINFKLDKFSVIYFLDEVL